MDIKSLILKQSYFTVNFHGRLNLFTHITHDMNERSCDLMTLGIKLLNHILLTVKIICPW